MYYLREMHGCFLPSSLLPIYSSGTLWAVLLSEDGGSNFSSVHPLNSPVMVGGWSLVHFHLLHFPNKALQLGLVQILGHDDRCGQVKVNQLGRHGVITQGWQQQAILAPPGMKGKERKKLPEPRESSCGGRGLLDRICCFLVVWLGRRQQNECPALTFPPSSLLLMCASVF